MIGRVIIYKNILFLILILVLFLGCEGMQTLTDNDSDNKAYIELERDGEIYSIMPEELSNAEKNYSIEEQLNYLNQSLNYFDTSIAVDNDIYNFLIVVPIKSKQDILKTFNQAILYDFGSSYSVLNSNYSKASDGYFHYKLYNASNKLASRYQLNYIRGGQTIYYEYSDTRMGEAGIDYTTNELIVEAEELKELLERLGITHERLEHQY